MIKKKEEKEILMKVGVVIGRERRGYAVEVLTQTTPNVDSIKVIPKDREVMKNGKTIEFEREKAGAAPVSSSPLAILLFDIEGIKSVYFGSNFISINKSPDIAWSSIKPSIDHAISSFFDQENYQVMNEDHLLPPSPSSSSSGVSSNSEDDEVIEQIKELIETRIRPSVQDDGGDIDFCVCPPLLYYLFLITSFILFIICQIIIIIY